MSEAVAGVVGDFTVTITPPDTEPSAPTTGASAPLPAGRMMVGVTVDPTEYETRLPLYPGNQMCRVFSPPGSGMTGWPGSGHDDRVARIWAAGGEQIRPACTFKDWADDHTAKTAFDQWLNVAPEAIERVGVDLAHMHEGDAKRVDAAEYRRRQFLLAQWITQHPRGKYVRLTPTQTLQYTQAKSRPGKPKGDGNLVPYFAGVGTPALDMYADSWVKDYPDPVAFCEPLWQLRDATGQAPAVPELGAARVRSDTTGAGRAAWLTAVAEQLAAGGCASVCLWDDLGTGGTNLRLTDDVGVTTPEVTAWRAVIARYGTSGYTG
jgi:hypothetical protein